MTGYSRDQFGPAWADVDHNGCDTRNDVLRDDMENVQPARGCIVTSGVLAPDPYSGKVIDFTRGATSSERVQIDHVVALGDAWQSGAQSLTLTTRTLLGNDPYNLLAVDGALNEQKGDANAASWLPPNGGYRCQYVARQVGVKAKFGLSVTAPERDSIARVLATCPGQPLPIDPGTVVIPPAVAAPGTTPATSAAVSGPSSSVPVAVHPGAFCTPSGATGLTGAGTSMVCKPASDGRLRWAAA
jgi:hypothetical protein